MAQPHIVDHTRLHLDILAETPIVAAFPVRKQRTTMGVQTGFDCGTPDELHYEEDVVSVCWGAAGLQMPPLICFEIARDTMSPLLGFHFAIFAVLDAHLLKDVILL
jgi:hypothetical protein